QRLASPKTATRRIPELATKLALSYVLLLDANLRVPQCQYVVRPWPSTGRQSIVIDCAGSVLVSGRVGVLSFVRRHVFDRCRELLVLCRINRTMLDHVTSGILTKFVATFRFLRRPKLFGYESAAAVRADVLKDVINARSAERSLIAANPRFKRIWRQLPVAVLPRWSEFRHAGSALP